MRCCLWVAALLFFGANLSHAQCISGDCKKGEGVFVFKNGEKYVGAFQANKPNGTGVYFYTDGSRYHGEFVGGLPEGEGVKVFKDGQRRSGQWKKGRLVQATNPSTTNSQTEIELVAKGYGDRTGCVSGNCVTGNGVYIFTGGSIYIGQFEEGEIHGFGVCHYPDGSKYTGEWKHRYPDGQGTKIWPDGREHRGRWQRGLPVDNDGKYLPPIETAQQAGAAAIQSGCLRGNCQNGSGYYAYPDGSRYEGSFNRGKPNGRGIFHYPNGDRYEGGFRNGYRHGDGYWRPSGGQAQRGRWDNGSIVQNQVQRKGCISGDCKNGFGAYIFEEGNRYIGHFANGLPEGNGEVIYTNGERYEGNMAKGYFDGYGTFYEQSGNMLRGYWQQSKFIGAQTLNSPSPYTATAPAPKLKVWAVIVGVSAYNHMPALRYPDDDAYRIFAFLKSAEGGGLPDEQIRILIDEDAQKRNIKEAMREVFFKAGPNDLVFLYFSGHGLPGSFLPIDYDGVNNILYHEEIKDILEQSKARFKLCLADACHSGSLLSARGGQLPSLLSKYYESLASADPGTALMMSSKSNETSLESSGLRQGVFSHYLLRGFKGEADLDANKIVSIQELFDYVQRNVRAYTNNLQSPVMQGDYDPDMTVSVIR